MEKDLRNLEKKTDIEGGILKMRKKFLLVTTLLVSFSLISCGNNTSTDDKKSSSENIVQSSSSVDSTSIQTHNTVSASTLDRNSVKSIFDALKNANIPIAYVIVYTDATDPNGSGKHSYIEKGNFADSRIEKEYSKEEPLSGSVEIFSTKEEAQKRADTLEIFSSLDNFSVKILSENVLLRLNGKYSSDEIEEFRKIIDGTVYFNSSSTNASDNYTDELLLEANTALESITKADTLTENSTEIKFEDNIENLLSANIYFTSSTGKDIVIFAQKATGEYMHKWSILSIKNAENNHLYWSYGQTGDVFDIYDYDTDVLKTSASKTQEQILEERQKELEAAQEEGKKIKKEAEELFNTQE